MQPRSGAAPLMAIPAALRAGLVPSRHLSSASGAGAAALAAGEANTGVLGSQPSRTEGMGFSGQAAGAAPGAQDGSCAGGSELLHKPAGLASGAGTPAHLEQPCKLFNATEAVRAAGPARARVAGDVVAFRDVAPPRRRHPRVAGPDAVVRAASRPPVKWQAIGQRASLCPASCPAPLSCARGQGIPRHTRPAAGTGRMCWPPGGVAGGAVPAAIARGASIPDARALLWGCKGSKAAEIRVVMTLDPRCGTRCRGGWTARGRGLPSRHLEAHGDRRWVLRLLPGRK
jgi:hypothetical protein